jgi:two-component system, chemotaxis family, chemotaxis protein CheY
VQNKDLKRVMVVDDTSSISFALGEWLKDEGIQNVEIFENPEQAVEEIKKNGAPDFIITDYDMPGMNGVEFLKKVNSDQNVEAIIMTAYPSDVSFENGEKKYEVIEKKLGFIEKIVNKIRTYKSRED